MFIENAARRSINGGDTQELAKMQGAMLMARELLGVPESLTKDDGVLKNLRHQKIEDNANLSQFLIRRQIRTESLKAWALLISSANRLKSQAK